MGSAYPFTGLLFLGRAMDGILLAGIFLCTEVGDLK